MMKTEVRKMFGKWMAGTLSVLLLILGGCGTKEGAAAETGASTAAENPPAKTEANLSGKELDDAGMQKLIDAYATVLSETFGAEIDFSAPVSEDETARYYAVSNFKTIAELREYITQYVTADLIDSETSFRDDFVEKDGRLLAVRGGRGYGYYGIDPSRWNRTEADEAEVQLKILDEVQEDRFMMLFFSKENDGWKVSASVIPGEGGENAPVTKLDESGVQTLVSAYATVMDETFGAKIDFAAPYAQDDLASYYAVKNYASVQQIKDHITAYIDEKLIDEDTSFRFDFEMKDGQLCAVRGGRGYGYYAIDPKNWKMDTDTSALVQFMLFDDMQEGSFVKLDFGQKKGMWKVVSVTLPEGF